MSERPGDGYPHWMAVAFHICLVLPTGLSVMTWNSELISHLADASSGESLFVLLFYAIALLAPLTIGTLTPTRVTRWISVLTQITLGGIGLLLLTVALDTSAELGQTIMRLSEAAPLQLIVLALLGIGAFRSASLLTRHSQSVRERHEEETHEPDHPTS